MFKETLNNRNQQLFDMSWDLEKIKIVDGIEPKTKQPKIVTTALKIGQSYYLKGCTGSGKTMISLQLAKGFINQITELAGDREAQGMVKFVKYSELCRLFKSFGDESKQTVKNLSQIKFLIIDDLGVGYGKDHSIQELEDFIDERMGLDRDGITIFTTNIKFDLAENQELAKSFGRVLSRVSEICTNGVLTLPEIDWRGEKTTPKQFDFSKYRKPKEVGLTQGDEESLGSFKERIKLIEDSGDKANPTYNQVSKEKFAFEKQKIINQIKSLSGNKKKTSEPITTQELNNRQNQLINQVNNI